MTIHNPITTLRVKMPQPHTRSTFDRNFNAAASSNNPIVAFTDSSHAPERGSAATACGAQASTTNGNAKIDENTSRPPSGHCQSPCDATTSNVPRKGAVQVNDVRVNARLISKVPAYRPRPASAEAAVVRNRDGSASSNAPNRFSANSMNRAAMPRFNHGFAAN